MFVYCSIVEHSECVSSLFSFKCITSHSIALALLAIVCFSDIAEEIELDIFAVLDFLSFK